MNVQVEKLEKNMAKLTVEVEAEKFVAATVKVYNKQKNQINVQGFRKGKAPQAIIEKMYGAGIFYEDAADALIQEVYGDAARESGLDIVSYPAIDVVQIEKGKNFIFTAEVAVRPEVELGDTVVIDYVCSVDGVEFEGGKGENYPLELGSNSFIPGFEDQLVGAAAGADVDVNVTFPE